MTTISGTTHAEVLTGRSGLTVRYGETKSIELADDIAGTATVVPGAGVIVAPADNADNATGGWVSYSAGQSFAVVSGQRVLVRSAGTFASGDAGVTIALSGAGLERLRGYDGTRASLG